MTSHVLNEIEAALIQDWLDGKTSAPPDSPPRPMRAETLRRLILGKVLQFPGGQSPEVILPPPAGIRFKQLVVDEELCLSSATGSHMSPLPDLSLEQCTFKSLLDFRETHFSSLSLANSQFSHLNANHLISNGGVDLSGVFGVNGSPNKVHFEGPEVPPNAPGRVPRVQISTDKVPAICIVTLREARIDGTLRLKTANLSVAKNVRQDRDEVALDLTGATIHNLDASLLRCCGPVQLTNADIKGNVDFAGAALGGMSPTALVASRMSVMGNVNLDFLFITTEWSPVGRTTFGWDGGGDVTLDGASIAGTLTFTGASFFNLSLRKVKATSIITRNLIKTSTLKEGCDNWNFICSVLDMTEVVAKEITLTCGEMLSLKLSGADVGKDLRLSGLDLVLDIDAAHLKVGRDFLTTATELRPSLPVKCRILILRHAVIERAVILLGIQLLGDCREDGVESPRADGARRRDVALDARSIIVRGDIAFKSFPGGTPEDTPSLVCRFNGAVLLERAELGWEQVRHPP